MMITALKGLLRPFRSNAVPRIMLFGDSHCYAVQRALERRVFKRRSIPLDAFRQLKTKGEIEIGDTLFENFLSMVKSLRKTDVVVSMIGGNQHAIFSTVQHPQPFMLYTPGDERARAPATGDDVIPYHMLFEFLAEAIGQNEALSLTALRAATSAHIVHCLPPPPKRNTAHILQYHESRFSEDGLAALGVSAPDLRLAAWRTQADVLRSLCARLDIELIAPPAGACDAEGFLASDYYANDATHGNPLYGEMVLQQIEVHFGLSEVAKETKA